MAFRQPTHVAPRHLTVSAPAEDSSAPQSTFQYQPPVEDSQEWVLFSPSQANSTTTRTHTTSTERTPRTAGLSRISDFGSLDTGARSGEPNDAESEDAIEDDAEMDSLDDGLHAFREPSVYRAQSGRLDQSGATVLPTHDGLGTFPASSPPVQDQLWQYEQYNPKRKFEGAHRRRSSVQRRLDTVNEAEALDAEEERRQRIEQWRLDQSKALLDEIEKETRRRRHSRVGLSRQHSTVESIKSQIPEDILGTTPTGPQILQQPTEPAQPPSEDESFWQRITRKVIRDLIGIDDSLLSVIFGESLPEEASEPTPPTTLPTIPEQAIESRSQPILDDGTWQDRLLERIARELGILVHQLSSHPGAFSTYLQPHVVSDYAGIPISSSPDTSTTIPPTIAADPAPVHAFDSTNPSTFSPAFSPTLNDPAHAHAASWGIEDRAPSTAAPSGQAATQYDQSRRDREYWERELDIKMVFRFLRSRFGSSSSRRPSSSHSNNAAASSSSAGALDPARRAAIIRQHHPLVARAHATRQLHHIRRPSSSCASQSLRGGAGAGSNSLTTKRSAGSSRNYWDLNGSVGSGSIVGSSAGLGAWGEV